MKPILAFFLAVVFLPGAAMADVDLSGMSFDELVALKDDINLAIWQSAEWQEVQVPQGVWIVGEDIPAGKWTIRAIDKHVVRVYWSDKLDESGVGIEWSGDIHESEYIFSPNRKNYDIEYTTEVHWDLKDGHYIIVNDGIAVFSPYSGKPSLGFK